MNCKYNDKKIMEDIRLQPNILHNILFDRNFYVPIFFFIEALSAIL